MLAQTITLGGGDYLVTSASSAPVPGYVPLAPAESRMIVRAWMHRHEAVVLRDLLAALASWRTLSPLDEPEAFERLVTTRFDDHCPSVVLYRREPRSIGPGSGSPEASAVELSELASRRPEPKEDLRAWIEIRLEDRNGKPVPRARYEVLLDSRELRQGYLDQEGFARIEGLPEGTCKVCFPDYDQSSWNPA